jgi:hypothetical protein
MAEKIQQLNSSTSLKILVYMAEKLQQLFNPLQHMYWLLLLAKFINSCWVPAGHHSLIVSSYVTLDRS